MSLKFLINSAIWSSVSHILSRGSLMLSGMLLASNLSPEMFATYSYFQITATMIATYSALGLGVSASKYFAELSNDKESKYNIDIVTTLFSLALLLSILSTLIILIIPNSFLSSNLNISNTTFSFAVLVLALSVVPNGAVIGLEKYKQSALFSFLNSIILLIGAFLSIKLNDITYSIYSFIIGSANQSLGNLFITLKAIPSLSLASLLKIKKYALLEISKFTGPLIFISLFTASSGWLLGKSLLKAYGELEFAAYSIGLQWFSVALFLPGMISRVVLPRLVRKEANNKSMLRYACLISIGLSSIIFILGSIFRKQIVSFYGSDYVSYEYMLVGFLFTTILYAPANTLGNAIIATVGTMKWLSITIGWFACLMSVFYLNLPNQAVFSAIYAQVCAASFLLVYSFLICRKNGLI